MLRQENLLSAEIQGQNGQYMENPTERKKGKKRWNVINLKEGRTEGRKELKQKKYEN
jgi:hypothetical protein